VKEVQVFKKNQKEKNQLRTIMRRAITIKTTALLPTTTPQNHKQKQQQTTTTNNNNKQQQQPSASEGRYLRING
jgi:N-acetylglucosamine-6-phosphate deacetylase